MNHSVLKNFAAEARKKFRASIAARLDHWLSGDSVDHRTHRALIEKLKAELEKTSKAELVDRVAYTWFNRFAALRVLDAAGHPFAARVITGVEGRTRPEILEKALAGDVSEKLTEADTSLAATLEKLQKSGRADTETAQYRALLLAACHFYGQKLPFLFEKLDDFAELLLPVDLLSDHALLAPFRTALADEDCAEVEVIGWLYQYYISERKDEVMARKAAVPTEDIPAVTQLFTPHWIVRYLVENSLGRLWLLNRPDSRLRDKMPYFVPSETPPTDFLKVASVEEIKVFDPACGSGHMLTYAFDLLAEIYAEEGYLPQDAARLILENNLFGADICPRAAALAGFSLTMKARALDKRLLSRDAAPPRPHILALRDVKFDPGEIQNFAKQLKLGSLFDARLVELLGQFENATTFGSLIRPVLDAKTIAFVRAELDKKKAEFEKDLFLSGTVEKVRTVFDQAELLADARYQVVVANPPYMGGKGMNPEVKAFMKENFEPYKSDLFSAFVVRGSQFTVGSGQLGFVTPNVWMYISSHEELRRYLLKTQTIHTLVELPLSGFDGATVQLAGFAFENSHDVNLRGGYIRLVDFKGIDNMSPKTIEAIGNPKCSWFFRAAGSDFAKIPGSPVAYWVSQKILDSFSCGIKLDDDCKTRKGMSTGLNDELVRNWHEINYKDIGLDLDRAAAKVSKLRWYPYANGGAYRKWYGNFNDLVNWQNDGFRIQTEPHADGTRIRAVNLNLDYIFKCGASWTSITSGNFSIRKLPKGFLFSSASNALFSNCGKSEEYLGLLNSKVHVVLSKVINPTLNANPGDIGKIPWPPYKPHVVELVDKLTVISKFDWDSFETSWDFTDHPFLRPTLHGPTLAQTWANWDAHCHAAIAEMQRLETENNKLWIEAYGLQDELRPEVPEDEITLARADRRTDAAALVSYALGCAFGRYSPDKPGLILANAGDTADRYYELTGKTEKTATFPVDADGILPVLDGEWFEDDATARVTDFIRRLWGESTLRENLAWLETSLGTDLRSYLAKDFFKDHLKTYKKRPIYWQVSSPKGAFRALFYLHRYDRDTVNRLLNDYVRAFLHKLEARLATIPAQIEAAGKAEQTRLKKEAEKITKQLKEIREWERDTVLPFAQARLPLDLDDGVKVNYLKFPGLLTPIPGLADKEEE